MNEKQFRYNDKVSKKLEAAQANLEQTTSSGTIEDMTTAVNKAKKAIKKQYVLAGER